MSMEITSSNSAISGRGDASGGRLDGGGDEQTKKNIVASTTGGGEASWVVDIQERANTIDIEGEKKAWNHSIYKVPACIRVLNPDAYTPQVVSFGPYHHGEEAPAAMEEHKTRSLVHLLWRCKKPLTSFVSEMKTVEQQLMDAYAGLQEKWRQDPEGFLKLMILDGCFMLEVMRYSKASSRKGAAGGATILAPAKPNYSDYGSKDPIFSWHGVLNTVPIIKRDMLMMENQLPLLVLSKLAAVESGTTVSDDTIHSLVLEFLAANQCRVTSGLHLLDVYRQSLLHGPIPKSVPDKRKQQRKTSRGKETVVVTDIIRSATELNEAGIQFKLSESDSLRDIHFKHGVLSLPVMVVDDLTECTFLNLMAFERLHAGTGNEVTSYVFFMDNIIDSPADVSLLNSKAILHNAVGSDKEVARLFNTLSKDVALDPNSRLDHVHGKVNKYCRQKMNKWRANLIHTYFRNPWAALSLAAAIFLLALTVAQTVFTVLQWDLALKDASTPTPPLLPPPSLLAPSPSPTSSPF
ncbi:hypothetical protein Taro_024016 [Colocasia esculenta]|uniref:Uncharacterized protein n=1 Tax=Colocasia esculenta TaxID=4460 RepID=A0A843V5A0_COLES|nr:hypothetical protein [Colocasia esculenta]